MSSETIYTHPHFVDNKYNTLYFKIINNAKQRSEISGYTEKHHIIPRSMGGSDSKENLVVLIAREHFICHYLLTKFTTYTSKRSMVFAFRRMKPNNKYKQRYFNSRLFKSMREDFSKAMKELHTGKTLSEETKQKARETRKKNQKPISEQQRINYSIGAKNLWKNNHEKMLNAHRSEESRRKRSESSKNKVVSEESRNSFSEKMREKNSGSGNPMARKIEVINPFYQKFEICGELQKFCKENDLPFSTVCYILSGRVFNKGKTVGWTFRYLD